MRFKIGPFFYRCYVSTETLFDDDGHEACGIVDYDKREILLAASIAPEHRIETLLHELAHCWQFHFPRPKDDEESAQFHAVMTASALADLNEQGGEAALRRLRAADESAYVVPVEQETSPVEFEEETRIVQPEFVQRTESKAPSRGGRGQCARCCSIFADGSIVSERVVRDRAIGGRVVRRTMYCGHCNHLQQWTEAVDAAGVPTGDVTGDPAFITGKGVEKFLAEHPQAAAILMACV